MCDRVLLRKKTQTKLKMGVSQGFSLSAVVCSFGLLPSHSDPSSIVVVVGGNVGW